MNLIILLVTVKFGKSKWLSAAILDFRAARTAPWYDDDCRREKKNLVVLRNSTVVPRQKLMKSYGKFNPNINGSSFNRNSETTEFRPLIRAEATRRLFGPNCGSKCRHHCIKTQAISLPTTLLHSSRRRLIRYELQLRALHHLLSRNS